MNEDYYENEINKNMNDLETLDSKAKISDEKELYLIVDQMGQAISNTEKAIKDLSIYNVMNNNNDQTKTNQIQRKLTDSKKRWKKLKEKLKVLKKNNNNTINEDKDEEDTSQSIRFNSFNKLQQATRSTIEMESMSGNILGDLNNQSSQMKNVSSKIGLINEDIDSSNNILSKMFSRQSRDKKIIIIFGIILFLIFLGTLTYKIVNKFK
jgi:hypothetical protein